MKTNKQTNKPTNPVTQQAPRSLPLKPILVLSSHSSAQLSLWLQDLLDSDWSLLWRSQLLTLQVLRGKQIKRVSQLAGVLVKRQHEKVKFYNKFLIISCIDFKILSLIITATIVVYAWHKLEWHFVWGDVISCSEKAWQALAQMNTSLDHSKICTSFYRPSEWWGFTRIWAPFICDKAEGPPRGLYQNLGSLYLW
jgi:hypothetical protein